MSFAYWSESLSVFLSQLSLIVFVDLWIVWLPAGGKEVTKVTKTLFFRSLFGPGKNSRIQLVVVIRIPSVVPSGLNRRACRCYRVLTALHALLVVRGFADRAQPRKPVKR